MKLYNLRWNPLISSFKDKEFRRGFTLLNAKNSNALGLNWSFYEWQEIEPGDWAIFTRVGLTRGNGLVGIARITSKAYEEQSWRSPGKVIHYADLDILCQMEPETLGMLTCEDLDEAVPGIDLAHGHAGVVIPQPEAEELVRYLVLRLAKIQDWNSNGLAVRRHHYGLYSVFCGMLSDLCPQLLEKIQSIQKPVDAMSLDLMPGYQDKFAVNIDALRSGKRLEKCLTLLDWTGIYPATGIEKFFPPETEE